MTVFFIKKLSLPRPERKLIAQSERQIKEGDSTRLTFDYYLLLHAASAIFYFILFKYSISLCGLQ